MTNPNAPFGLRPARSLGHANTQVNEYAHVSGDSNPLYIGDAVVTTGTSTSGVAGIQDGTPVVTLVSDNSAAGTTANLRGAVTGVRPNFTNLTLQYCPASVNLAVLVADDPYQIFEVQSDGTVAAGDISANAKYINGTGSTSTGLSGGMLHESTVSSSNDYTLRILRLAPIVGNTLGANAIVEVLINDHELKSSTGES